jgi:hypothetical protein
LEDGGDAQEKETVVGILAVGASEKIFSENKQKNLKPVGQTGCERKLREGSIM